MNQHCFTQGPSEIQIQELVFNIPDVYSKRLHVIHDEHDDSIMTPVYTAEKVQVEYDYSNYFWK